MELTGIDMKDLYTKLHTDQTDIRNRLTRYMMKHKMYFNALSVKTNINKKTLTMFLKKQHMLSLNSLARLTEFLDSESNLQNSHGSSSDA